MHWIRRLVWRLEVLFRKGRAETELDEELQYHLEKEIEANVQQGMGVEEARRKALVEFGGFERIKEEVRDVRGARGLDDLRRDLRYATRRLAKSPAFAIAVVLTLAVGIGITVAIFSALDAALLRALPYPEPDRLVLGRATFSGDVSPFASFPDYMDYRDGSDGFEALAAFQPFIERHSVTGGGNPEMAAANWVTVDLFKVLDVEPHMGRTFAPDEAKPSAPEVVMISYSFWQRRFGGASDAVGQTINIAGTPTTVVGIMPPDFHFRTNTALWRPVRHGSMDTERRRSHSWQMIGRMKDGITLDQAQAQMDVISAQLTKEYPETHENKALLLTPLGEALAEGYRPALLALMGATTLLLLIACVNVAGILVARATTRKVELSVRTALGASRRTLVQQLFTESLLLAFLAGIGGSILALWLQPLFLTFFPLDLLGITEVKLSGPMLSFAVAVSFATAILFGIGPALTASRTNPAEDLKGGRRNSDGSKGRRVRGGLVVVQVALSVVLLTASGLLIRSFVHLQSVNVGFLTENVFTAGLHITPAEYDDAASRARFYSGILEDVRSMPGVVAASVIDKVPIRHRFTNWHVWDPANPPKAEERSRSAMARSVLPGYFDVMGIPILRGRDHKDWGEESLLPPVVINQRMAKALFSDEDPIGRQVSVNVLMAEVRLFEVVGVVRDFRITSVNRAPFLQMYFSYDTMPSIPMNLVFRAQGDPAALVPAIRRAVHNRDPDALLTDEAAMADILSDSISENRILSLATALFATAALFLSMTGLYAILTYYVAQKTQEIGIRVAFGATTQHIMGSVLRRGLLLVAGGLVVGLAGAFGVTRLIESQLFQVGTTDPITFGGVAVTFLVIGTFASLVPAWSAARVDPVQSIHLD